ncbi:hypothetical protein AAHZ94_33290, partial [Streptomyces sp. HSW2009]
PGRRPHPTPHARAAAEAWQRLLAGRAGTAAGQWLWTAASDPDRPSATAPVPDRPPGTPAPDRLLATPVPGRLPATPGPDRLSEKPDPHRSPAGPATSAAQHTQHTPLPPYAHGAARPLGLTAHPLPVRPELGPVAAGSRPPFDRSVYERVATTLRTTPERADLPPVPELVADEITRGCAPWALHEESLRVAATVGVELALGLRPLGTGWAPGPIGRDGHDDTGDAGGVGETGDAGDTGDARGPGAAAARGAVADGPAADSVAYGAARSGRFPVGAPPAAPRAVNARWQREAYVLRTRRLTLTPGHPRPADTDTAVGTDTSADPRTHARTDAAAAPAGPLAKVAAELHTPWRAYVRRLWVRLHGRDVRTAPLTVHEVWDVLDGVARSVMLDHRAQVRQALAPATAGCATAPGPAAAGLADLGAGR